MLSLLLALVPAHAAKGDPPKQPWFERGVFAGEHVSVEIRDAFLNKKEAIAKLKFINTSDSYVRVDLSEATFTYAVELKGEGALLIPPGEFKNRNVVHQAKGIYTLEPKIHFGKVSYAAPTGEVAPEPVPYRDGKVSVGGIHCKPDGSIKQDAKFTEMKYVCTNASSNVGVLRPSMISLVTENGTRFSTLEEARTRLLEVGKRAEFKLKFEARRPLLDAHGKGDGDRLLGSAMVDFKGALFEAAWTDTTLPDLDLKLDPVRTEQQR